METHDEIAALKEALRVAQACESVLQAMVLQLEHKLQALQDQHAELWQAYQACVAHQASLENHDG